MNIFFQYLFINREICFTVIFLNFTSRPLIYITINYSVLKLDFVRNLEDARPHGVKKLAITTRRGLPKRNNDGSFQKCETRWEFA